MGPEGVKVNAIKQPCPCPASALREDLRPEWYKEKVGEKEKRVKCKRYEEDDARVLLGGISWIPSLKAIPLLKSSQLLCENPDVNSINKAQEMTDLPHPGGKVYF